MKHPTRFPLRAFVTHELEIALAIFSLGLIIVMPLAKRFHWHPLLAIAATLGIYGLFILLLNVQNLKEDFQAWYKRKH